MSSHKDIEYYKKKCLNQEKKILKLEKELLKKENFIKSFPQLSNTSLGQSTSDNKIVYRNWFIHNSNDLEFCDHTWFTNFLKNKFPNENYKLNIFGIYGNHDDVIKQDLEGKKVFYTAEDISHYPDFNKNFGYCALYHVDLSIGFEIFNHPKYIRIPYWLLRNFFPNFTEEDIENKVDYLNTLRFDKTKDVVQISSHDRGLTRSLIADDVEKFVEISYAGNWRNNTSELWTKFDNNKIEYLKQFKFNICAENTNSDGYITEKIFDAFQSSCIPLYIGGGNYMEPKVLNSNAILKWDFNKDNLDVIELFYNLLTDNKSYEEFKNQNPPLLDTSSKFIIKKFNELEKQFERLIFD